MVDWGVLDWVYIKRIGVVVFIVKFVFLLVYQSLNGILISTVEVILSFLW